MHHAKGTGWQWGVQSCIMTGLPTYLVQELNVGTVLCVWGGGGVCVFVDVFHLYTDIQNIHRRLSDSAMAFSHKRSSPT